MIFVSVWWWSTINQGVVDQFSEFVLNFNELNRKLTRPKFRRLNELRHFCFGVPTWSFDGGNRAVFS